MARTNLKIFRIKKKLSQQEIADKIGYMRATYSAIETGKRQGRQAFWDALKEAFNIPDSEMWELMQLDEEKPQNNG